MEMDERNPDVGWYADPKTGAQFQVNPTTGEGFERYRKLERKKYTKAADLSEEAVEGETKEEAEARMMTGKLATKIAAIISKPSSK
ncbi:hypothetical protein JKY72_01100 [Candidatus Gracilibacteria bacterium]|nr:hypothetical protein [Candidatus Gracilibacteria bacterium]